MTRRLPIPFLPVPTADWRDGLSRAARLALGVYLRRWSQGDDVLRVALREVEGEAGLSKRGAEYARDELVRAGILVVVARGRGKAGRGVRDAYRLALVSVQPVHGIATGNGATSAPQADAGIGALPPAKRVQPVHRHREEREGALVSRVASAQALAPDTTTNGAARAPLGRVKTWQ